MCKLLQQRQSLYCQESTNSTVMGLLNIAFQPFAGRPPTVSSSRLLRDLDDRASSTTIGAHAGSR